MTRVGIKVGTTEAGATDMSGSDARALSRSLLDLCRMRKLTIATAESCTGGLVAGALTDIPGSSDVIDRGFVTYSNDAKRAMLGVKATTLATFGAGSRATAAGVILSGSSASFSINRVRALLERRCEPLKRGIEHRPHQHRQHPALEFVG